MNVYSAVSLTARVDAPYYEAIQAFFATPKIPAKESYWSHYLVENWQHFSLLKGLYMNDNIRKYIWSEILSAIDDLNHPIQRQG